MRRAIKRILLVDDDPRILQLLGDCFKDGYAIDMAMDGGQALTIVQRHRPDIVLLDITLPGMSGLDILKELKKTDPTITVVMVTGNDSIALAADAIRSGATGYVPKPFDLRHLAHLVADIIVNRTAKRRSI
jgi:DNA-binding NtrC family response regulator